MGFLSEFLHPTRWYSKILVVLIILAFFSVMAIGALSGFLLYRVVSPVPSRSQLDFSDFPGHPEEVTYQVPGEGSRTHKKYHWQGRCKFASRNGRKRAVE